MPFIETIAGKMWAIGILCTMDLLEIPATLNGETRLFEASVRTFGYTYRLCVEVDGVEVYFEPDEQGAYRVVLASPELGHKTPDKTTLAWIKCIQEVLSSKG